MVGNVDRFFPNSGLFSRAGSGRGQTGRKIRYQVLLGFQADRLARRQFAWRVSVFSIVASGFTEI